MVQLNESTLFDMLLEGCQIIDPDFRFIYVNNAAARQGRKTPAELIGQRMNNVYPEIESTPMFVLLRECMRENQPKEFENKFVHADGTVSWFDLRMRPVPQGVFILSVDISDRKQAEENRKKHEDNLRSIFNAISESACLIDRNGILLTVNDTFASRLKTQVEDCIGRSVYSLFPPKVAERRKTFIEEVLQTGRSMSFEDERQEYRFSHSLFPVLAADGTVDRIAVFAMDITERTRVEEALERSEARFRKAMEATSDGVWDWDVSGGKGYFSPGYFRMLGYEPDTLPSTAKTWLSLVHPDDRDRALAANEACIRNESPIINVEYRMRASDGTWHWILGRGRAVRRDKAGHALHMIGTHVDITDRKHAENLLRESEARFTQLAIQSRTFTWEVDAKGLFTYASPSIEPVLGYRPDDLISKKYIYDLHPAEGREAFKAVIFESFARKNLLREFLNPVLTTSGETIWVSTNGIPLADADGTLIGYRGSDTDVTERKQAEEERERLQAQLMQAQKMESVGRLAGGIAHDFNNMLGVIIGHAESAIEDLESSHPVHSNLQGIMKAAERSAALTHQLLAFARKQIISPKVVDMNETVESILKMLRRLIGEDIELVWQPGREQLPVEVDPSQVDQILANLCVNARDAIAGGGKVVIETGVLSLDAEFCKQNIGSSPREYVLLAVSDNGCGMDRGIMEKLFEPFFTTKEQGKGTGLGLATVYGIVKQNNGFIDVDSEPAKGTTFRIYLPKHARKDDESPVEVPTAAARGHETILLVEDEPEMLRLITKLLRRQGYTVLSAATPGQAMGHAEACRGKIDLLVTDVVMPEMNGRDLAEKLKSGHPELRYLFMSGYTADVIAHHGVLDEKVHFIQKPFSIKAISAKIRDALGD